MRRVFSGNRGQGMTEYILIIALIAIMVIGGVKFFGHRIKDAFKDTGNKVAESVQEGIDGE